MTAANPTSTGRAMAGSTWLDAHLSAVALSMRGLYAMWAYSLVGQFWKRGAAAVASYL
jgi:hypothetical protein